MGTGDAIKDKVKGKVNEWGRVIGGGKFGHIDEFDCKSGDGTSLSHDRYDDGISEITIILGRQYIDRLYDYMKQTGVKTLSEAIESLISDVYPKKIESEWDEKAQQREQCYELYEKYLACEPAKNEYFVKAFTGESGIIKNMRQFHEMVEQELVCADSMQSMYGIAWKNVLQFLAAKLDEFKPESVKEPASFPNAKKFGPELKQIINDSGLRYNSDGRDEFLKSYTIRLKQEQAKCELRKKYEKIYHDLVGKEVQSVFDVIRQEGVEEAFYEKQLHALDDKFQALLKTLD